MNAPITDDSYHFERAVLESLSRIDTRSAVMETKLASLIELIADIEYDLDGNGRPGLKDRVTTLEVQVAERTSKKEAVGGIVLGSGTMLALFEMVKTYFVNRT